MTSRLLLSTALLLLLSGCPMRGGSGGDDDDDAGGGGSSAAWVRTSSSGENGTEYSHDLWLLNVPGACAAIREMGEVTDELNDIADAEYDDIVEEFGGTEGPGAQEALCESEQGYYASLLDADIALYQPGVQLTNIYLGGLDDWTLSQPTPGAYGDFSESDGAWYSAFRAQIDSLVWFEGWQDVDCADQDEYDGYYDAPDGTRNWDVAGGTLWVSNPSSNTTHAEAEDITLTDDNDSETNFTLDEDFPLCEINGD